MKNLSSLIFLKQKKESGTKGKTNKKKKENNDSDTEMKDDDEEGDEEEDDEEEENDAKSNETGYKKTSSSSLLSRFLFVVGHVALKQLVRIFHKFYPFTKRYVSLVLQILKKSRQR